MTYTKRTYGIFSYTSHNVDIAGHQSAIGIPYHERLVWLYDDSRENLSPTLHNTGFDFANGIRLLRNNFGQAQHLSTEFEIGCRKLGQEQDAKKRENIEIVVPSGRKFLSIWFIDAIRSSQWQLRNATSYSYFGWE